MLRPNPMPRRAPLLAALLAALGCTNPLPSQQVDVCAHPCSPGADSLGAACALSDAGPLDGICSAAGTCLAPCVERADCASLAPGAGPCESALCDAVSAACSYQRVGCEQ
jgi:hypothetical protein